MTTVSRQATLGTLPLKIPRARHDFWHEVTGRRLSQVLAGAPTIPFDNRSRLIFMSDCHRGNGNAADAFAANEPLYYHALQSYYRDGFTYVEVGDGDELWRNPNFSAVRRTHARVFDLLAQFDARQRLHMIVGNHELRHGRRFPVVKDGISTNLGLRFHHVESGQTVFAVHGHQADFVSDQLWPFNLGVVRLYAIYLQLCQAIRPGRRGRKPQQSVAELISAHLGRIEWRIMDWVRSRCQITICGHTHRPRAAAPGEIPYFKRRLLCLSRLSHRHRDSKRRYCAGQMVVPYNGRRILPPSAQSLSNR